MTKLTYEELGFPPGAFSYAFCDGCDGVACPSGFEPNAFKIKQLQKEGKEKKK